MIDTNSVTRPRHYQFDGDIYEVRDVIRERTSVYLDNDLPADGLYDYCNIIKYVLRGPAKNGIEDFKKAKYCLESLIALIEYDAENSGDGYQGEPDRDKDEGALEALVASDEMADAIMKLKEVMWGIEPNLMPINFSE